MVAPCEWEQIAHRNLDEGDMVLSGLPIHANYGDTIIFKYQLALLHVEPTAGVLCSCSLLVVILVA